MTAYLGLNQRTAKKYHAHFLPILKIVPRKTNSHQLRRAYRYFKQSTHVILTSPSSTSLFVSRMIKKTSKQALLHKHYLCVGRITAQRLRTFLPDARYSLATIETGEGVLPLITLLPPDARILYPHSALSRPLIKNFLSQENRLFFAYPHYTVEQLPLHPGIFAPYHRVIFTSPSTVRAYASLFPTLPDKDHWCQGPITLQEFQKNYSSSGKLIPKDFGENATDKKHFSM
ncbi:uroporphyrinogen-III synthase [Chlamydia vaughanii]|uniref:uroporphyrinogen-III synthase n=1 Tax=Chlamydia vaughanii TaxID=3112552 RepID=UPI0032B19D87